MKKASILLLALLMTFSLMTACGRNNNNTNDNNAANNGVTDNNGTNNGASDNDKTPAGDLADGVGDLANGVARAADDVWNGILDLFGADRRPRTVEGDQTAFAEYGLNEDLIESYTLQTPENGETAHEFFIAKVKEGKMAEVEAALEKRKEAIAAQWGESVGADMDYARQPVILKSGNYIMLAVHEDIDEVRAEFERLTKAE